MKYILVFNGKATVRAFGMKLEPGFRKEVTPDVARHFDNPSAKKLGFKIIKSKENDDKKKEVKTWSKK
ncbi:MAG: hypothetical protein ACETWC_03920 [Acidobacteriota bacterium]